MSENVRSADGAYRERLTRNVVLLVNKQRTPDDLEAIRLLTTELRGDFLIVDEGVETEGEAMPQVNASGNAYCGMELVRALIEEISALPGGTQHIPREPYDTSGRLILFVTEPASEADEAALVAVKKFDPTVEVTPVTPRAGFFTPRLDAIEYNSSVYRSLDSIQSFIKMQRRKRERAKAAP